MIIEGLIRYHNYQNVHFSGNYDNVFYFEGGFIGELGFTSRSDNYISFLICVDCKSNKFQYATNMPQGSGMNSVASFIEQLKKGTFTPFIGIWVNERDNTIVLSRDLFGAVPLFYIHIPGELFAFSTSLVSLLRRKELNRYLEINVNKIVTYGTRRHRDFGTDASSTFFSNIKSCLPGHLLTISETEVKCGRYVSFHPERWEYLKTADQFSEATLESFTRSLIDTVPGETQIVGSHLSGGLDSSSISSLFRKLYSNRPLHTFHISANNSESDESKYASLVSKDIDSIHHFVNQPLDDLYYLNISTAMYGQPEATLLSPASNLAIISSANESGCKILLNGHGGDSIIGNGMEVLDQAFNQKNWTLTQDLIGKRVAYTSLSINHLDWDSYSFKQKYQLVLQDFLYRKFSGFKSLPVSELFKIYTEVSKGLGISNYYFGKRAATSFFLRLIDKSVKPTSSIMRDELVNLQNSSDTNVNFPLSLRGNLSQEYQSIFEEVFHPHIIRSQEQFFVLSNHFGVSNRSPFMNHALFELSLAIPYSVKYGNGIGRAHFRDAMKGILIENVRSRSTKSSLSSPDGEEMTLRLLNQSHEYLLDVSDVWNYIDKTKFNEQVRILKNNKIPCVQKSTTYFYITRTISLSVWLEWIKQRLI